MCEPASIIGAVLSAGSMAANSAAQSQVTKARNDALAANDIRQRANQQKIDALNTKSQQSYDEFGSGQAAKAGDLASYFKQGDGAVGQPQGAGQPTETAPGSQSNIVQQEQAKQSGKAKAYTDQQGGALGNLRSFGDYLGGLDRTQARDAGAIGQYGNFQQGDAAVLPYALEAANHAGDGLKGIADLARAGGSLGLGYGLTQNVAGGAAGAANTAASSLPAFAVPQAAAPLALNKAFSSIPSMFNTTLPKVY